MSINNINNVNVNSQSGLSTCCENNFKTTGKLPLGSNINFGGDYKQKAESFLSYVSKNFSSPHQRATLGITALCTQPFIDLHNKHIKQEDKPVVVAKTIAKIIVGTTVGIILRHHAIKAVKNFTKSTDCGKYSQLLLPKKIIDKIKISSAAGIEDQLDNYRKGLGTFIGVMSGLVTNFAIDAPLTKILTNVIHEKIFDKEKANGK